MSNAVLGTGVLWSIIYCPLTRNTQSKGRYRQVRRQVKLNVACAFAGVNIMCYGSMWDFPREGIFLWGEARKILEGAILNWVLK